MNAGDAEHEVYARLRTKLWPMPLEQSLAESLEILAQPAKWAVFLARAEDGASIGFLEVCLREYAEGATSSPVGFLEGWFVSESIRGQGVGRLLAEAGETWARSMGCTEMGSDTEIDRTGSIEAHARLGYKEVERLVCFLKKLT